MQRKINAQFPIGTTVRHRLFGFRGIVFDVDPQFNNTEEWYQSIPEAVRPRKDQPFYHLLAQNHDDAPYIAYVSEQNLEEDTSGEPLAHPDLRTYLTTDDNGQYKLRQKLH